MKMLTFDVLMAMIVIVCVLSITTFAVVDRVLEYRESTLCISEEKRERVGGGPRIPKCDKELWLRITEGCKEPKI